MGRALPPGASWVHYLPPGRRNLLPPLPLQLWRRRPGSPSGNLILRAPTFPRSPARARFREEAACCHSHPPRWRHADDALLNILASVSSRAWPVCLVDVQRIYSINHGSKRVRSPRSADANLSRRFVRPSCKCSRARRMYHNLIDLRSDCGVSDCVDWRCSPKT